MFAFATLEAPENKGWCPDEQIDNDLQFPYEVQQKFNADGYRGVLPAKQLFGEIDDGCNFGSLGIVKAKDHTKCILDASTKGSTVITARQEGINTPFTKKDERNLPDEPSSRHFVFNKTTMFCSGKAHELGNFVASCLNHPSITASLVCKPQKFTIKTTMNVAPGDVTAKFRFYNSCAFMDGAVAIEATRLAGDSLSFITLFNKLAEKMQKRGVLVALQGTGKYDRLSVEQMNFNGSKRNSETGESEDKMANLLKGLESLEYEIEKYMGGMRQVSNTSLCRNMSPQYAVEDEDEEEDENTDACLAKQFHKEMEAYGVNSKGVLSEDGCRLDTLDMPCL